MMGGALWNMNEGGGVRQPPIIAACIWGGTIAIIGDGI